MLAVVPTDPTVTPISAGRFKRECAECGTEFRSIKRHAEFCTDPCRKAFNNRRLVRGAELYDLFMCLRYERPIARVLKVWALLCRMAQGYRDEDLQQRAGRNSWRPARQVLERHSYLRATVISSTTWRKVGR